MKNIESKKWVSVAGRALLAYLLVFAQGAAAAPNQATAAEKQSAAPVAAKVQSEEPQGEVSANVVAEKERPGSASRQGIKVHGHWMIEVRNPDGTLVTHREFENALVAGGGGLLAYLLNGQTLVAGMGVDLYNSTISSSPCNGLIKNPTGTVGTTTGPTPCYIVTASTGATGTNYFPNLSALVNLANGMTLSGTATAAFTTSIDTVGSDVYECVAPGPCVTSPSNIFANAFTRATVSPAISVTAGQSVAVTVTLSFS